MEQQSSRQIWVWVFTHLLEGYLGQVAKYYRASAFSFVKWDIKIHKHRPM